MAKISLARHLQIDHGLHGGFAIAVFLDRLILDHVEPGYFLDRLGALGVRLVVAVVVLRANVEETNCRGLVALAASGAPGGNCSQG